MLYNYFLQRQHSCHKTSITKKVGLDFIQNLNFEEKECLLRRSNIQNTIASQDLCLTVCYCCEFVIFIPM